MNKEFNPLLNYIVGSPGDKRLKVSQHFSRERFQDRHRENSYSGDHSIDDDKLRLALPALIKSMHVNRFMVVR